MQAIEASDEFQKFKARDQFQTVDAIVKIFNFRPNSVFNTCAMMLMSNEQHICCTFAYIRMIINTHSRLRSFDKNFTLLQNCKRRNVVVIKERRLQVKRAAEKETTLYSQKKRQNTGAMSAQYSFSIERTDYKRYAHGELINLNRIRHFNLRMRVGLYLTLPAFLHFKKSLQNMMKVKITCTNLMDTRHNNFIVTLHREKEKKIKFANWCFTPTLCAKCVKRQFVALGPINVEHCQEMIGILQ